MFAERAVEIFALLANETRLAIVSQLAQSDVPALGVCQLSQRVGVARSTAKRQAERLEEAGLLVQDVSAETVRWSLDENVFADFLSFQSRRLNFDANPESASQQGKFKVSVQLLRSPPARAARPSPPGCRNLMERTMTRLRASRVGKPPEQPCVIAWHSCNRQT